MFIRNILSRWILWPEASRKEPLSAGEVKEWQRYLYRRCNLWNRFAPRRRGCPLCGWKGWTYFPFVHNIYIRRGAICPGCGAVERHRAFALLLQQELKSLSPGRVLEVGPRSAFRLIFEKAGWKYLSLDIEPKFADVQGDVQNLPFSDGEFDGIICFHVLEHVPDDRKALREMRRCLKTGGVLFLAVPWFKDSATQEFDGPDPLLHGHVRRYGYDVKDRITEAGFQAELKDCGAGLSDKELQWWGIAGTAARGNVFICH